MIIQSVDHQIGNDSNLSALVEGSSGLRTERKTGRRPATQDVGDEILEDFVHIEEKGPEVEFALVLGNTRSCHEQAAESVDRFVVGIEAVVGELVERARRELGRGDFEEGAVDRAQALAKIVCSHPAANQVSNLPDDLVLRYIPGELGETAIRPVAEDMVEPHILPGRDPATHRGKVLFPFLVGAIEPVLDPVLDQFREIANDEFEHLIDLLEGRDLLPERRFEIERDRQHVEEVADPDLRLALETSSRGEQDDTDVRTRIEDGNPPDPAPARSGSAWKATVRSILRPPGQE